MESQKLGNCGLHDPAKAAGVDPYGGGELVNRTRKAECVRNRRTQQGCLRWLRKDKVLRCIHDGAG